MHYRPATLEDSNPNREILRDNPHGFLFTVLFIYIPVIILTIGVRAGMLLADYPIIHLRVVDSTILNTLDNVSNYLTQYAHLL